MRCRAGRIALLVFQAVWLNVILPGHQRGALTLPGDVDSCNSCQTTTPCPQCASGNPETKRVPTPGDKARCALCFFAVRLTIPATVDLTAPLHGFVERLVFPTPAVCESLFRNPTYLGRAPPLRGLISLPPSASVPLPLRF